MKTYLLWGASLALLLSACAPGTRPPRPPRPPMPKAPPHGVIFELPQPGPNTLYYV